MRAPSVKPQYGPTLSELLIPRWRTASVGLRSLVLAVAVVVLAGAVAFEILRTRNTVFAHSGPPVSFSLNYAEPLHAVKTPAGAYMRVEARTSAGRLREWFEVDPLKLGSDIGQTSGSLPVYATNYIAGLGRRVRDFSLQSETKTRVNLVAGYTMTYSGRFDGQLMYGRIVLLVPTLTGQPNGVILNMGIRPSASLDYSPDQVASADVLERPFRSFRFGS
jgi:hypothetical protein